ncbi:MAG: endonuclease MutS2, partial [Niameybacter sp.]
IILFYKEAFIEVHEKAVKPYLKCEQLYPVDYEIENLFASYKERKLEHDITRGSKKALKKIRKEGIEKLRS